MQNRKLWLIIKALLILAYTGIIFAYPTNDIFRKWLRLGIVVYFVVSFVLDLNRYRKGK